MHFQSALILLLLSLSTSLALKATHPIPGNTALKPCTAKDYKLQVHHARSLFDPSNNLIFLFLSLSTGTEISDGAYAFLTLSDDKGATLLEDNFSFCDDFDVECPVSEGRGFNATVVSTVLREVDLRRVEGRLEIFPPYRGRVEGSLGCVDGWLESGGGEVDGEVVDEVHEVDDMDTRLLGQEL